MIDRDDTARRAELDACFQRIDGSCERIISVIERILSNIAAIERMLSHRADVPLHKRGFGAMEDLPPP
jgi:hypothetical protein